MKRICFSVSDKLAKELIGYRAFHKNDKSLDNFIAAQIYNYIHKMNKKSGIKIEVSNPTSHDPKCPGKLVVRTSKFGKFLGCSNHPKCSYKESINAD